MDLDAENLPRQHLSVTGACPDLKCSRDCAIWSRGADPQGHAQLRHPASSPSSLHSHESSFLDNMDTTAEDSDNEFGYDFSAEEEELLLQLAAPSSQSAVPRTQFQPAPLQPTHFQPAPFQPAPFQPIPVNRINLAAIDGVPDHSDASAQYNSFRRVATPVFSLDSLQTEYRVQDGPPTISHFSTSSHQTVRYPDRKS